jgi:hypothetical protein
MPIRPEHRFFYPLDWCELLMAIRFGRAQGRCESCGRPYGQMVYHLGDALVGCCNRPPARWLGP